MSLLNHNSRTLWLLHKHRELPHIGFCACGYQRRLGTPFSDVFNMHTVICSPSVPSTNEKLNSRKKNTHKKIKKHIICSLLLRRWKLNLESQFSQVNWMRLPCRNKKNENKLDGGEFPLSISSCTRNMLISFSKLLGLRNLKNICWILWYFYTAGASVSTPWVVLNMITFLWPKYPFIT